MHREPTDALAAVRATQIFRDLDVYAPEVVVDAFSVTFEHKDGVRRVVLVGEWEVDPAALTASRSAV